MQQMEADQGRAADRGNAGRQGAAVNTEPPPGSPEFRAAEAETGDLPAGPAPDARSSGERFVEGFADNAENTWQGLKALGGAAVEGAKQVASDLWNHPAETLAAAAPYLSPGTLVAKVGLQAARELAAEPKGTVDRALRTTAETGGAIWHGIADPYADAYQKGGIAQAAGYGTFDAVRLALEAALTKGAVSAAGKAVSGVAAAGKVVRATEKAVEAGKRVESKIPTIGGRPPINWEYAGKRHPSGVWFNEQGFPDFRPHAKDVVEIENLTGVRRNDFKLVNKVARYPKTPEGYTWHHVEDGKTMLLVPSELHEAVPHTGGVALIRNGRRFDP